MQLFISFGSIKIKSPSFFFLFIFFSINLREKRKEWFQQTKCKQSVGNLNKSLKIIRNYLKR